MPGRRHRNARRVLTLGVGVSWLAAAHACGSTSRPAPSTAQPIVEGGCMVVGFLGGNDRWNDAAKGVRRLALELRRERGLQAETFENRQLGRALQFVVEALDADGSGDVDAGEATRGKLVVYGQSLGGWATLVFARLLAIRGVPVQLTLQIDSVGWDDAVVPSNVRWAANLYQDEGRVIAGEHPIRPADPRRTTVVGQWEFDYDRPPGSAIRIDELPWHKTLLRSDHARMDRDPRVWRLAERLVLDACADRIPRAAMVTGPAVAREWRERVGIEPTPDATRAPDDGFEDRRGHQTPSAPVRFSASPGLPRPR